MALKFDRNAFMLTILFIIFCLPIVLSVARIGLEETRQFSVYNTNWDGTSILKENLESEGYEFQPIVSTLNVLTRIDDLGVLALVGPTIYYDPTETAALAYFVMRGGSVLIADDFGSANDILGLINAIIAPYLDSINMSEFGFGGGLPILGLKVNKSLLLDYESYHQSPVMPVIKNFLSAPGLPSIVGVTQVVTSYPSAIGFLAYDEALDSARWIPTFTVLGNPILTGIAGSTSNSSLEQDVKKARRGEFSQDEGEWGGVPFSIMAPLPLGAAGLGNILICSDPSIFTNELMRLPEYDNAQYASNLFDWLDINGSRTIFYDEGHLSPSKARAPLSILDPFSYVSMYLRYINSFTMFPLLAPFFPIIALIFLKRNYPKGRSASPLLMTKIKQKRSRSFFAAKMSWYVNYEQYDKALNVLYKRLKRRLDKKFNCGLTINFNQIVELLKEQYPDKFNYDLLSKNLNNVELFTEKKKKLTEENFLALVLEMKNIEDIITKQGLR